MSFSSQVLLCQKSADFFKTGEKSDHLIPPISKEVEEEVYWNEFTEACKAGDLPAIELLYKNSTPILQRDYPDLISLLAKNADSDVERINDKWTDILKRIRGDYESEKLLFKSLVGFIYDGDWENCDASKEFIKVGLLRFRAIDTKKKLRKSIKRVKSLFKASLSTKEDLQYVYKALMKSKRISFLTDFISLSNWSVNKEHKEFVLEKLDRLKKTSSTKKQASKAELLLTAIESAHLHKLESNQHFDIEKSHFIVEPCSNIKKITRLIDIVRIWKKRAKNDYLVAASRAAGLSVHQKMRLKDSKRVMKMIQIQLEYIKENIVHYSDSKNEVFIAVSDKKKVLGIAISKVYSHNRETELRYLAVNPDNLNIIKKRNFISSGVGVALVNHVVFTAEKREHDRLFLRSTKSAIPWYIQKFGFQRVVPQALSEEPLLEINKAGIARIADCKLT